MKYILRETAEGYQEIPAAESGRTLKEGVWQQEEGEVRFLLGEEIHIFDRPEELKISKGDEADLRIPGTDARLYLSGSELLIERGKENHIYLNQRNIRAGQMNLQPGDVLFLATLKIVFEKEQIAVVGNAGQYQASLPERCPKESPFDGFPVYKRSPRLIRRLSSDKITLELPGEKEKRGKKDLLTTILPPIGMALVTTAIGIMIGRGIYMLMSVAATGMTVIFSIVKFINDNNELKEKNRNRELRYTEYLWKKQREIEQAYRQEQEVYRFQYPEVKELCEKVRTYDSRIYERVQSDDDFLTVSVGHSLGGTSFRIESKEKQWDAEETPLAEAARAIRQKFSSIDKPKIIDLKKAHLGLVGEKETLHHQIRLIVSQLAFFQSYHDLQIIAVYDAKYEDEFSWMRWLPHTRIQAMNALGMIHSERTRDMILGSMNQILKERRSRLEEGKKEARFMPHYLFLIDEPSLVMDHAIMEYLSMDGNDLGFSIIYTSYLQANLPEYIGTVLLLENSREATLLLEAREYKKQKLQLFQAGQDTDFEWMARNLSVLEHEQGITSHIPKSVSFFEMYQVQHPEELNIRQRWSQSQSHKSLAVPLGLRAADDILYLNLHEKAHGPHGLVAGTTGSGKSETIQSYILSLAVNFHPHEVGFLLIDYKGGGMANLFKDLPHLLGTITNLDGSESMRALASVKAELSRRQRVFGEHGVNHINGYMKLFKEGAAREPIPHLFIISDEFAELKKEQPEFMKELVSAARIGRSLGVHLILATQKPTGVVDDQIWSNSKFKLCLKVQDESDSKEVLKTPDAAGITLPGRAYLQVGNNEIYELFQSAWSGAAYIKEQEKDVTLDDRVYTVNELGQGELINQDLSGKKEEQKAVKTQLDVVIGHIREIYDEDAPMEVKKPWLPPLPRMLENPRTETCGKGKVDLSVEIGLLDIPERQTQQEYSVNLARQGNILYVASSGYGKSVFLANAVLNLAVKNKVSELNFYVIDFGNNALIPLSRLPHMAAYIMLDDEEKYAKFLDLMQKEIKERKKLLASAMAQNFSVYNETAATPLKAIVIAIDNYDAIKEMGYEMEQYYTKLTRDGVGLGIYVIAAASQNSAVRTATMNNFKNKIAGVNFDENEVKILVGRSDYTLPDVKGRSLVKIGENISAMQIYSPVKFKDEADYGRNIQKFVQKIAEANPGEEAPHIPILPDELDLDDFMQYESKGAEIGIGLDKETVVRCGITGKHSPFLIFGNNGSGKTNALKIILGQLNSGEKIYLFDSRSRALYGYKDKTKYITTTEQLEQFAETLSEETRKRRIYMDGELSGGRAHSEVLADMEKMYVIIDDLDDFIELAGPSNMPIVAGRMKRAAAYGIVFIVTANINKMKGIDEFTQMLKNPRNGLLVSSQGYLTVFPVKQNQAPEKPDGYLLLEGAGRYVRIPLAENRAKQVQREEERV